MKQPPQPLVQQQKEKRDNIHSKRKRLEQEEEEDLPLMIINGVSLPLPEKNLNVQKESLQLPKHQSPLKQSNNNDLGVEQMIQILGEGDQSPSASNNNNNNSVFNTTAFIDQTIETIRSSLVPDLEQQIKKIQKEQAAADAEFERQRKKRQDQITKIQEKRAIAEQLTQNLNNLK